MHVEQLILALIFRFGDFGCKKFSRIGAINRYKDTH